MLRISARRAAIFGGFPPRATGIGAFISRKGGHHARPEKLAWPGSGDGGCCGDRGGCGNHRRGRGRHQAGRDLDHRPARRASDLRPVHPLRQRLDLCHRPGLRAAVSADATGKGLVPGLAESWDISPDGSPTPSSCATGVKFSNGQPVTVDDAVFSLQQGGRSSGLLRLRLRSGEVDREGRRQPSAHHPEAPYTPLLSALSLFSSSVVSKADLREGSRRPSASKPVCTGPFKVESYERGTPGRARPQPELLAHGRGRQAAALSRQGGAEIRAGEQFARARPAERRFRRHHRRAAQPGRLGQGAGRRRRWRCRRPTGSTTSISTTPRSRSTTSASAWR